jgi:hypothetical protein
MNGTHPQSTRAAAALLWTSLICAAGCQTHPTAVTNPFAAPDRVPPPATRTLLPGQAVPYYQGDPLPAMQSATTPRPAATANANPTMNNWTAPRAATTAATNVSTVAGASPTRRADVVFSGESSVRIPSDNEPLRATPPRPAPKVATAPAQSPPASLVSSTQPAQAVTLASFNQPASNSAMSEPQLSTLSATPPTPSNMWRSPGIARQNNSPSANVTSLTGPVVPAASPRFAAAPTQPGMVGNSAVPPQAASSMNVRLRAVPSPPPPPVESAGPRIRLPGYSAPQPISANASGAEPAGYYIVGPQNVVQTVQIAPLGATAASAPPAPMIASSDGFRARGSMR